MPLSDEDERRRVEQEIRKLTNPPCGERFQNLTYIQGKLEQVKEEGV